MGKHYFDEKVEEKVKLYYQNRGTLYGDRIYKKYIYPKIFQLCEKIYLKRSRTNRKMLGYEDKDDYINQFISQFCLYDKNFNSDKKFFSYITASFFYHMSQYSKKNENYRKFLNIISPAKMNGLEHFFIGVDYGNYEEKVIENDLVETYKKAIRLCVENDKDEIISESMLEVLENQDCTWTKDGITKVLREKTGLATRDIYDFKQKVKKQLNMGEVK